MISSEIKICKTRRFNLDTIKEPNVGLIFLRTFALKAVHIMAFDED